MRALVTFFSLTFLGSWILFAAAATLASEQMSLASVIGGVLYFVGIVMPSLVAVALTVRSDGSAGLFTLLRGIADGRAGMRWYLFAASYMVAIKLAAAALHRMIAGTWPPFGQTPLYVMAAALVISTPVQAGEEIGWRGYALPRLASQFGRVRASVILGVIWACWHLPFFFIPGTDTAGQSFPVYLLQVTALSVAMAWLYWHTRESLLPVMLMHAAINNTKDIVPSAAAGARRVFTLEASLMAWLTLLLLSLCGVWFLLRMNGPCRAVSSEARETAAS